MHEAVVSYRINPVVTNDALNALFAAAWPDHAWRDFRPVLDRSLAFVCAYDGAREDGRLRGFVTLAWDGGVHAFILDTTVHPDRQRRGIGRRLVEEARAVARERGMIWLHVDFAPHLRDFYRRCGFLPTEAGLMQLEGRARA